MDCGRLIVLMVFLEKNVTNPDDVKVVVDGETTVRLRDFFKDNDMSNEEMEEIVNDLLEYGVFNGGGGASAEYTLKLVS